MSYFEIEKDIDKIVHLLYAGKINNILGLAIVETCTEYGEDRVNLALKKCKKLYPFLFD